ncbi:UL80.5 [Papio ursinus cytomegalovirus]|nr:UL80.5 [Papio ursinus cytomegalovirus]AKG51601.1 UL80.5 [Papiine betaherpesvirus 4]
MSHPLSAVATPAASSVAPSQASLALAPDGVYLPKDAFFSLIGASRPMAEASGARAAYPAAHPPPAYPVMSYEDPSRHYDYGAWLRRPGYDAGPSLPPPAAIPLPYRRRDPMMDEVERAAWERGYAPSVYDHYGAASGGNGSWSRARGGALKRRRERDAASSDDDEDMSFPGEADHGKARKRLKAHHARGDNSAAADSKGGDRYDEIREALQELKREMLAVRQVAPPALLTPTQLATPVVSSPTTTSHQPEVVATSEPPSKTPSVAAPSAVSAHSSKSADRGVVNASCRVAVPGEGIPPKDMVDLNRRLFVAALNKME